MSIVDVSYVWIQYVLVYEKNYLKSCSQLPHRGVT